MKSRFVNNDQESIEKIPESAHRDQQGQGVDQNKTTKKQDVTNVVPLRRRKLFKPRESGGPKVANDKEAQFSSDMENSKNTVLSTPEEALAMREAVDYKEQTIQEANPETQKELDRKEQIIVEETMKLPAILSTAPDMVSTSGHSDMTIKRVPGNLPAVGTVIETHLPMLSKKNRVEAQMLQERCRQFCLSLFLPAQSRIRSLGFTSSVSGEGKSFLSALSAEALSRDIDSQVVLLECNWDNPDLRKKFNLPDGPGLSNWIRGECTMGDIEYPVSQNFSIIPAGEGRYDAVRLLTHLRDRQMFRQLEGPNRVMLVDLPPVVTSAYGMLAASLVDALVLVVRAGNTSDLLFTETCAQLKGLPVQGVILNQMRSRIPRWLLRML